MEVLIVILILAIVFVAFMGVMSQALKVSSRSRRQTEAVMRYENFLFELENGLRADLVSFGGRGELGGGYQYAVNAQESKEFYAYLKSKLTWNGKESLDLDLVMPEAGIQ